MATKKKAYHRMPNGTMMAGAKHEGSESKMEKKLEYGSKPKAKPKKKK